MSFFNRLGRFKIYLNLGFQDGVRADWKGRMGKDLVTHGTWRCGIGSSLK